MKFRSLPSSTKWAVDKTTGNVGKTGLIDDYEGLISDRKRR